MRNPIVLMNVGFALATAAGLYGYIRHINHAAYMEAVGFCGSLSLTSKIQSLATIPVAVNGVPCKVVGSNLRFPFQGLGSYSAICVAEYVGGVVTATSVIEER